MLLEIFVELQMYVRNNEKEGVSQVRAKPGCGVLAELETPLLQTFALRNKQQSQLAWRSCRRLSPCLDFVEEHPPQRGQTALHRDGVLSPNDTVWHLGREEEEVRAIFVDLKVMAHVSCRQKRAMSPRRMAIQLVENYTFSTCNDMFPNPRNIRSAYRE